MRAAIADPEFPPPLDESGDRPLVAALARQFVARLLGPTHSTREQASNITIAAIALGWIAVVGLADYWTGPEYSMLVFYLMPITLGTWFLGRNFGTFLALLSIIVSSVGDLAAGLSHIRYWNELVGLMSYVAFVRLLSRWRTLLQQLDVRVRERTAELQEEILERARLEKEMNEVTERERRRLGHDLHDSLCQHLTGTALSAQALREKLAGGHAEHAEAARTVVHLVEQAIDLTRTLARGLLTPDLTGGSLPAALDDLAQNSAERFGIECEFHHEAEITPPLTSAVATQLYRIAQEAVVNASKHAHPKRVVIELDAEPEQLTLNVYDDGIGFDSSSAKTSGLGLRMMQHGAELIGGTFAIRKLSNRGCVVSCSISNPVNKT